MAIVIPKRGTAVGVPPKPAVVSGDVKPNKFGIMPRGCELPKGPVAKKTPKFIEDNPVWNPPPPKLTGIELDLEALLVKHPLPDLPDGRKLVPYDWQKEDIETLVQWDRVGVFLPVGAGKTLIATLVALAYNDKHRIVLLPPILIRQWVRWLNAIPGSGGAIAYKGTKKQRAAIDLKGISWWVMSYGIFRNDFHKLLKLVESEPDERVTVIVDEAQNLKNVETWTYRRTERMSVGNRLILMTGTELNSPLDAYAYVAIKTPGVYRGIGQFKRIHVEEEDEYEGTVQQWKELELMNRNLYLQSVQRTKEDIHKHVPAANYYPVFYDLEPEHLALYNELAETQLLELESGGKIDATSATALYVKMQQCVIDWNHFAGATDLRPAIFDLIDQSLEEINFGRPGASKFIIWTWFKHSTKAIKAYVDTLHPGKWAVAYSESNSEKEVARFMEDDSCLGLVAQPLSAGAGLNPQFFTWECLFAEVPTRTIPFRQAAGRIDRDGQRFNANVRIGIANGTIQLGLYENLLANDALVQRVQRNPQDLRKMIYGVGLG